MRSVLSAVTMALLAGLSANTVASPPQAGTPLFTVSVQEGAAVEHRYAMVFPGEGADRVNFRRTVTSFFDRIPGDADMTGASLVPVQAGVNIIVTPLETTSTGAVVTRVRYESSRFLPDTEITLGDKTRVRLPNIDVIARLDQTVVVTPGGAPVVLGNGTDGSVISVAAAR